LSANATISQHLTRAMRMTTWWDARKKNSAKEVGQVSTPRLNNRHAARSEQNTRALRWPVNTTPNMQAPPRIRDQACAETCASGLRPRLHGLDVEGGRLEEVRYHPSKERLAVTPPQLPFNPRPASPSPTRRRRWSKRWRSRRQPTRQGAPRVDAGLDHLA
jgi:hypothetical protein